MVADWTADTAKALRALANSAGFVIFEDRKFADIGNTVVQQCKSGVYSIASWADFVNAHSLPGPGIVAGLKEAMSANSKAGILLLAEMSSKGNLINSEYTKATIAMEEANQDFVFGFIAQNRLRPLGASPEPALYMTPGVKIGEGGDALGQQYNTPQKVVANGTDVIIVGRGVYGASDPAAAAKRYAEAGWAAYLDRVGGSSALAPAQTAAAPAPTPAPAQVQAQAPAAASAPTSRPGTAQPTWWG